MKLSKVGTSEGVRLSWIKRRAEAGQRTSQTRWALRRFISGAADIPARYTRGRLREKVREHLEAASAEARIRSAQIKDRIRESLNKHRPGGHDHDQSTHGRRKGISSSPDVLLGNKPEAFTSVGGGRSRFLEKFDADRNDPKDLARASMWATKKIKFAAEQGYTNSKTVTRAVDNRLVYEIEFDTPKSETTPVPPKPKSPEPEAPIVSKPKPEPVKEAAPTTQLITKPVGRKPSKYIDVPNARTPQRKLIKEAADRVLEHIDKIHGIYEDAERCEFEITKGMKSTTSGQYRSGQKTSWAQGKIDIEKIIKIRIRDSLTESEAAGTITHEIGHYIDNMIGMNIFNSNSRFMTEGIGNNQSPTPGMKDAYQAYHNYVKAVQNSPTVQKLHQMRTDTKTYPLASKKHLAYLLSSKEIWARTYTQYIASKSKDAKILEDINRDRASTEFYPRQWQDDEFKPIEQAMDRLFVEMGLTK